MTLASPTDAFEAARPALFRLAYRMLGGAAEAEDAVQDAWLRFQALDAGRVAHPRALLVRTVTRLCLDRLKSARARRESYVGEWLPEPLALAPERDAEGALLDGESLSMAFLVLLQSLSPAERAVFLLRQAFELDYPEIAEIVEKSEANCRQLFHRAQRAVEERRARFDPASDERRRLIEAFRDATRSGDVAPLVELLRACLHEQVEYRSDGGGKQLTALRPILGRDRVVRLIERLLGRAEIALRHEAIRLNGEWAMATWLGESLFALTCFEYEQGLVRHVWQVVNPQKLERLERQLRG
jgi:RNA polymerase sigma-70 factor (ECF subfamily)